LQYWKMAELPAVRPSWVLCPRHRLQ
jgi:hypothetical protein